MTKPVFRSLARGLLIAVVILPLAACNTMEGLGKDIQSAGKVLQNSAEKNKDE